MTWNFSNLSPPHRLLKKEGNGSLESSSPRFKDSATRKKGTILIFHESSTIFWIRLKIGRIERFLHLFSRYVWKIGRFLRNGSISFIDESIYPYLKIAGNNFIPVFYLSSSKSLDAARKKTIKIFESLEKLIERFEFWKIFENPDFMVQLYVSIILVRVKQEGVGGGGGGSEN